jgi:hypothetical protein
MLFCQLGQAHSLREICGGLAACEGKLRHLGLPDAPKRSTLAYANAHPPWEPFQDVFQQLYHRCQSLVNPTRRFRVRYRLLTLDATMIERTKGAVKLHLPLDPQGYMPQFVVLSPGKTQEIEDARSALAGLENAEAFPSLLIADLSSSDNPEREAELLSCWANQFPLWVISSHMLAADAELTGRGFERILSRPIDLGELVEDVKHRVL